MPPVAESVTVTSLLPEAVPVDARGGAALPEAVSPS